MQLTCPACGAQYEIEDGLIPAEGRSVQCSVCEHVWREKPSRHGDAGAPPPPRPGTSSAPTAETSATDGDTERPAPRRPAAEEVRAILREEADREARMRKERGLIEIQPDLGLPPGRAAPAPRRSPGAGPLPDPDRINETLRAASHRAAELRGSQEGRPARGGFLTGLLFGLCIVGLAALLYATAPRIADAVPEARPALQAYVSAIDDLRLTLDSAADRVAATISSFVE